MQVAAAPVVSWILLPLLLGSGMVGLPLATPPLPDDPLLARIAPEECLWYFSSNGMAAPDAASENHAERLFAEEDVRQLAATLERQLTLAFQRNVGRDAPPSITGAAPKLVKALLTRPMAMYVADFRLTEAGPQVDAGLVVNLGEDVAEFMQLLMELEKLATRGEAVKTVTEEGVEWRELALPDGPPVPVRWGIKGRYLLAGVGEGAAGKIITRARTGVPAWLTEVRANLPVERVSTVGYLNVHGILRAAGPIADSPMVGQVLTATGLGGVTSLQSVAGMDETGCVAHTLVALDGEPAGLFRLAEGGPLTRRDLATIPADATFAAAVRLDAEEVFETIVGTIGRFEPRAAGEIEQGLDAIRIQLGVDVKADILGSLDDVWTIYASPADGGFPWLGAVASVRVKDRASLASAHDRLVMVARAELPDPPDRRRAVTLRDFTFAGQKVHYLNFIGEEVPFAPAWCLTEDRLVAGLYPQSVKSFLSRSADDDSLADIPQVDQALGAEEGPMLLGYVDTRAIFRMVYPLVQLGVQMGATQWQREGVDIDVSILPAASTIERHLQPTIATVSRTGAGIQLTTRQTLPAASFSGAAPLAAGLMLPAIQSARGAARRTADMNSLRQIGMAMHVHHDVYKRFPPAVYGRGEKPGLSWRVALLPFIEEDALYRKFHLDEPWDSEHNIKLIEHMPAIYRSAAGPTVVHARPDGHDHADAKDEDEAFAAYRTRFVVPRHEDAIFSGKDPRGTSMRNITDGTSNTILLVQAAPESAAIWTKPDDWQFDPERPKAGLSDGEGFFLALFADAYVRRIGLGVSDALLRALVTRGGGEAIDHKELDRAEGRHTSATSTKRATAKAVDVVPDRPAPPRREPPRPVPAPERQ